MKTQMSNPSCTEMRTFIVRNGCLLDDWGKRSLYNIIKLNRLESTVFSKTDKEINIDMGQIQDKQVLREMYTLVNARLNKLKKGLLP